MSKNPITIPMYTTHFFVNTKNKKTFYSGSEEEGWSIYNKGLDTWEKVPNLDLTLIPIEEFTDVTESQTLCSSVENTDYSITLVKSKKHENVKDEFRSPALTLDDLQYIYKLFEKHSGGTPLGFIPGEINWSVYYDHELNTWAPQEDYTCEGLTIYTTNYSVVEKVIKDLNQI